jgi:hypothetical protein
MVASNTVDAADHGSMMQAAGRAINTCISGVASANSSAGAQHVSMNIGKMEFHWTHTNNQDHSRHKTNANNIGKQEYACTTKVNKYTNFSHDPEDPDTHNSEIHEPVSHEYEQASSQEANDECYRLPPPQDSRPPPSHPSQQYGSDQDRFQNGNSVDEEENSIPIRSPQQVEEQDFGNSRIVW